MSALGHKRTIAPNARLNYWKRFRLRKEHRRLQGIIQGKRCGVTENIGAAARTRWKEQQEGIKREPSGNRRNAGERNKRPQSFPLPGSLLPYCKPNHPQ